MKWCFKKTNKRTKTEKKNKKYELCGVAKLVQRHNLSSGFCCKCLVHPETQSDPFKLSLRVNRETFVTALTLIGFHEVVVNCDSKRKVSSF